MVSRSASPLGPTGSGRPSGSSTTSEQVASKLSPATSAGEIPAAATASRTAAQAALQMSREECSTISPGSRQIAIGRRALASRWPDDSKTPARALPVPTSTPI